MASPSGQGLDTPQVQFVLKFFDHLSARNLGAAFSLLSETLVYEMWPASLAHSPRTKSEYKALLDTNPDRDVKFEILETIESPGKVVVTLIIVSLTGGRYSKESCYIFTLGFDRNGSRTILHIKEIVDSKAATDIHREERERLLEQNA
ncbi:hypothetical protein BJ322DRAFT_1107010 [Thelephora terrestris]|uniref:SnoaL-like domain-containing protein n=1 Tax=Thelephora terrestris TaxID=56493 RepID=A0A9P6L8M3_9AGAM|nr:hypothetical protein BJ322DRAFT_1107010 [Thelephora terrestris]